MQQTWGKYMMVAGILLALAGLIIYFFGNKLNFIGKLPGDIRIEGERGGFYFPIVTCILLSIIISFILWFIRWLSR